MNFIPAFLGLSLWLGATALLCEDLFHSGHARKSGGSNKLHQGLGSITFTGIVRSELLITSKVQSDGTVVRTVEKIKGTVGRTPPPLRYVIEETENQHGKLRWLQPGEFGLTADTKPSATPKKLGQCRDFIVERLLGGPVEADIMIEEVTQAKYSPSTRDRAKKGLVESFRKDGVWWWKLAKGTQSAIPKGIDDVEDDVLPLAPPRGTPYPREDGSEQSKFLMTRLSGN